MLQRKRRRSPAVRQASAAEVALHQERKQSVALIKERAAALEQAVAMLQRGIDDSRAQALPRQPGSEDLRVTVLHMISGCAGSSRQRRDVQERKDCI